MATALVGAAEVAQADPPPLEFSAERGSDGIAIATAEDVISYELVLRSADNKKRIAAKMILDNLFDEEGQAVHATLSPETITLDPGGSAKLELKATLGQVTEYNGIIKLTYDDKPRTVPLKISRRTPSVFVSAPKTVRGEAFGPFSFDIFLRETAGWNTTIPLPVITSDGGQKEGRDSRETLNITITEKDGTGISAPFTLAAGEVRHLTIKVEGLDASPEQTVDLEVWPKGGEPIRHPITLPVRRPWWLVLLAILSGALAGIFARALLRRSSIELHTERRDLAAALDRMARTFTDEDNEQVLVASLRSQVEGIRGRALQGEKMEALQSDLGILRKKIEDVLAHFLQVREILGTLEMDDRARQLAANIHTVEQILTDSKASQEKVDEAKRKIDAFLRDGPRLVRIQKLRGSVKQMLTGLKSQSGVTSEPLNSWRNEAIDALTNLLAETERTAALEPALLAQPDLRARVQYARVVVESHTGTQSTPSTWEEWQKMVDKLLHSPDEAELTKLFDDLRQKTTPATFLPAASVKQHSQASVRSDVTPRTKWVWGTLMLGAWIVVIACTMLPVIALAWLWRGDAASGTLLGILVGIFWSLGVPEIVRAMRRLLLYSSKSSPEPVVN